MPQWYHLLPNRRQKLDDVAVCERVVGGHGLALLPGGLAPHAGAGQPPREFAVDGRCEVRDVRAGLHPQPVGFIRRPARRLGARRDVPAHPRDARQDAVEVALGAQVCPRAGQEAGGRRVIGTVCLRSPVDQRRGPRET